MTAPIFTVVDHYSSLELTSDGRRRLGVIRSDDWRLTVLATQIIAEVKGGVYIPFGGSFLAVSKCRKVFVIYEVCVPSLRCIKRGISDNKEVALATAEVMAITKQKAFVPYYWKI